MKEFLSHLRGAIASTLVLAVVCCGVYPLIVFGISQLLFHHQANGSLITAADGSVRGSKLLGQAFSDPKYFHPRPSAAGNGYDATMMIAEAIRRAGTDHGKIRDAIEGTRNHVGVTAVYSYSPEDHFGAQADSVVMLSVKDGKFALASAR